MIFPDCHKLHLGKNQIGPSFKHLSMILLLKRGETIFLEFSIATGTCYLTSHRLSPMKYEKGRLFQGLKRLPN
jgi:hypothetical protein